MSGTSLTAPVTPQESPALEFRAAPLRAPGGDEGAVGVPPAGKGGPELGENRLGVLPGAGDGPEERTMAGPGVPGESAERGNDLGPERVEVQVADEFEDGYDSGGAPRRRR